MQQAEEKKDTPPSKKLATLNLSEKIRLALTGDKETRTLLSRESNKVILTYLLQNPRLTDHEILQMASNKSLPEEVLAAVLKRREWMKKYPIRLALAMNPKVPLPSSLKLVSTLLDPDLRKIARSRDVSVHIATKARRILAARGLL